MRFGLVPALVVAAGMLVQAATGSHPCSPLCASATPSRSPQAATAAPPPQHAALAPVVQALASMAASNETFQCELCQALWEARNTTAGFGFANLTTPAALCVVLDAWLVDPPEAPSPYVHAFDSVWNGRVGHGVVREPWFRGWVVDFLVARGAFMDSTASAGAVQRWIRQYAVNMSQFPPAPPGGYASFNQWFIRPLLSPAMRPVASPRNASVVTAPADALCSTVVAAAPTAGVDKQRYSLKGEAFNLAEVFGNSSWAAVFAGGPMVTCSVYPYFYHHVHAPVSGRVVYARELGGLYFGADTLLQTYGERRRGVYVLEVGDTTPPRYVALLAVAAFTVGSINTNLSEGDSVTKGQDLGFFKFGGSTVGLFFQAQAASGLVPQPLPARPTKLLVGQAVARLIGV